MKKRITGIVENHRVEVGGIVNAALNGNAVELAFTNSAVENGGHTIVSIPRDRLALTLGVDLANWFLKSLERFMECHGERIEATDLIQIQERGTRFEIMFADQDDETVVLSMPEDQAKKALGEVLYYRLQARSQLVRIFLLKQLNEARA